MNLFIGTNLRATECHLPYDWYYIAYDFTWTRERRPTLTADSLDELVPEWW